MATVDTAPAPDQVQDEFSLRCRLDDVNAQLGDPLFGGDVAALISERDRIGAQLKALDMQRRAREQAEYRAKLDEKREKFLADLAEPLDWLRENMPRMQYELVRLGEMERRLTEAGSGQWVDFTGGLPFGAAGRIRAAIGSEVHGTGWEELYTPPGLLAMLAEGREYARRKAEERAAAEAAAQAEFDRKVAEFEAGNGPDPREVHYTFRVLG